MYKIKKNNKYLKFIPVSGIVEVDDGGGVGISGSFHGASWFGEDGWDFVEVGFVWVGFVVVFSRIDTHHEALELQPKKNKR